MEYRLFPRSFYVTTKDIFSNDWSDPVYFGMRYDFMMRGTSNSLLTLPDALGYDAELFWDSNGDVRPVTFYNVSKSDFFLQQVYNTWCGINNAVDKIYCNYVLLIPSNSAVLMFDSSNISK